MLFPWGLFPVTLLCRTPEIFEKNCLLQLGRVQLLTWNQSFSVSAKFYSIYRQSIFFMLVLNFAALLIFALSRSLNIWEHFSQNYLSFENITAFFLKRHWLHKTSVLLKDSYYRILSLVKWPIFELTCYRWKVSRNLVEE